jgi:hypothetical protein
MKYLQDGLPFTTTRSDLYDAKQLAIKLMKVPKSKTGLLAIAAAYE